MDRPFSDVNKPFESLLGNRKTGAERLAEVSQSGRGPVPPELGVKADREDHKVNVMCFYCKKKGHIVASCPVLKERNVKPVALVNKFDEDLNRPVMSKMPSGLAYFAPFVMDGVVSLPGNSLKVPVKMLRDTAASQSFILEGVLPLSDESAVGSYVPVLGLSMENMGVLLHKILIESDLVSGEVAVGVRSGFPFQGVAFLMGNDLAGGKVLVTPEVTPVPGRQSPDELAQKFPKVFAVGAVT